MEKQTSAVEWLRQEKLRKGVLFNADFEKAKNLEKGYASTFGIRVTSECCTLKNGKMEVDLHKFETLLNEMYGE
jgi:hypothetical protein